MSRSDIVDGFFKIAQEKGLISDHTSEKSKKKIEKTRKRKINTKKYDERSFKTSTILDIKQNGASIHLEPSFLNCLPHT